MKKAILILILMFAGAQADNLKEKYAVYTEYLGMKTLPLNNEQLKKVVPKLEKKLNKDKEYKKIQLQAKLNKLSKLSNLDNIQQTICFSQRSQYVAGLADHITLTGGKCQGRKLSQMNRDGWQLIQVVSGLQSSFGMVFTKIR